MGFPKNLDGIELYITLQAQREIGVQILFALAAFDNLTKKGEGNVITTFLSIHSFLTHCANISKLLYSPKRRRNKIVKDAVDKTLAELIETPDSPHLKDRSFRDDLDHYDERLIGWIEEEYPKHKNKNPSRRPVSDLTIGDKDQKGGRDALHLRNYNPDSKTYTFGDRDLNLEELHQEILILQKFIGSPKVEATQ
ncbi:hypothetical protein HKL94_00015 [Candidatus Parcubacteria bacterium]|nr:hypothetical protein [Candidatus Parcubacteria bacterium]